MKFDVPPRSRPVDQGMIPLVNVVFLLLVFFVLTGTLTPPDPLEVSPPASTSGANVAHDAEVVMLSADGRIALRGEEIRAEELGARIEERMATLPTVTVQVEADRGTEAAVVLDVLDTLRNVGIERVVLRTEVAVEP